MPARPPKGLWRHAAAVLPASLVVLGLSASTSFAAPAPRTTVVSDAPQSSVLVYGSPSLTARRPALRVVPKAVTAQVPSSVVLAARVLLTAASLRGKPYHYGATGPRAFDCSGYTRYVFAAALHRSLPHSSAAQYRLAHKIAKSAIRPGDLVFFVHHGHVYHVGIYAGHGLIWHAPHTGDHVRLARISTSSWVAGRVL